MRHHNYNPNFEFVVPPVEFDKYTDRQLLQYCLGATMYMPGTKDFAEKILGNAVPGLTSMVLCFEDACPEELVPQAENNTLELLEKVSSALDEGIITYEQVPLIFCRVRSVEQFERFTSRLTKHQCRVLAGINFPKFTSENGEAYFSGLRKLNEQFGEVLYGMPIIEDETVAFKETRMAELLKIKAILDRYKDIVLQVRVGATDFSSCFGVRRGVDYSIYDILTVRECLSDILNVFSRNNDYVVSGPVWEYFLANKDMKFKANLDFSLQSSILKRKRLVNEAIDGLLREVIIDRANGFVGKTVIHPTHVKYVNAMQAVTEEEYKDAMQILMASGGALKSPKGNKMNEIKPHRSWARKIYYRAKAYGVIKDETEYLRMIAREDFQE